MSILKRIVAVTLCLVLCVGLLAGCGEKYKDAIVYFELLQKPRTLDPQTAQSDSELLIVRNIYEGLLREDSSGTIIGGVSESYSYENLKYTFNLRDDVVWSNGERLTTYDFEYGLRRAVDPKIKAPFASRLFCIANAEQIASGKADVSTLGVTALDETTLIITLCREDKNFLKTLTTSVAMPCNEQFFKDSIGKYGLDSECILSNGSYRLTKWNKEEFGIRIYKNEEYTGVFEAQNAAVFISCIEDETQVFRLADGQSDIAFLPCSEIEEANKANLVTSDVQNICWVMTVSREFNPEIRRAFAMCYSSDIYSPALTSGFTAAKSIYPEILGINAEGVGVAAYNTDESKTIMSAQIAAMEDKKFPQATLYYYETDGAKELATAIVGHWQQNLSTFINIESSTNLDVIQKEIGESTLQFALFPISVKSSSFSEYAKNFAAVSTATTPDALQQELFKGNSIYPVAYQTTNISYMPSLENVIIGDDNGYIDFSIIIKR